MDFTHKEAGLMDADTSCKTAAKLKLKIAKFSDTLRDEIERTTTGNVKNFVQALRDEELPDMREKLKCQFAVVDASQIKSWETLLSNGIMNSTDKVFTEGLDMEKKFQELEELQNYLYNIAQLSTKKSMSLERDNPWLELCKNDSTRNTMKMSRIALLSRLKKQASLTSTLHLQLTTQH